MFQEGAAEHGGVGPDVGGNGGKLVRVLQTEAQSQRQVEGFPRPARAPVVPRTETTYT